MLSDKNFYFGKAFFRLNRIFYLLYGGRNLQVIAGERTFQSLWMTELKAIVAYVTAKLKTTVSIQIFTSMFQGCFFYNIKSNTKKKDEDHIKVK